MSYFILFNGVDQILSSNHLFTQKITFFSFSAFILKAASAKQKMLLKLNRYSEKKKGKVES